MIPYWALFGVAAMGALVSGGWVQKRKPTTLFVLFGLVITLFVGLRFEVGADWDTYVDLYRYVGHHSLSRSLDLGDYGYQFLSWVVAQNNLDIWAVNLICAGFFAWGLMRFCSMQPNQWVAIAISVPYLVIVVAMGYTRQATALGFIMAGLADYIKRENLMRFAAYVFVGALFHSTAAIAFVLIGMTNRNSRFMNFMLAIVFAYFFYRTFISASVGRLESIYIERAYGSQGALVRVLLDVVAALAFYVFGKRLQFNETERKIWRNFSFASFLAFVALAIISSSTAIDRTALYLMPLQIAVFTRVALLPGISKVAVVGGFALVQFSWLTFAAHSKYWVPYQAYGFK